MKLNNGSNKLKYSDKAFQPSLIFYIKPIIYAMAASFR